MDVAALINKLVDMHVSVATAESCTGGLIASSIVDIPGASDCFNEGYVTYSNEAKMKNLGVSADTLREFGAVSSQTAAEMASGVRKAANADFGISSTGIAGPGGGTKEKPVGLVYIGCAYGDNKCVTKKLQLDGDRTQVRNAAAKEALKLLDECLNKVEVMA
ncbi:CinA family protein [Pseudobutyrivibrio ruminis]|uniref:CinA family protein n=1 Tax=Pseudobutyrivibrio ruminis TaxID=46206 RepID=UPI0003F6D6CB|nr:nicotinamide-nucleotide amidohydrolase family protein [Pseudobutyrivibrio ruminis]